MVLCDRCKDIKRMAVQRYKIYSLQLWEHNNFELPKDISKEDSLGSLDLCQWCAEVLKRNLSSAIYETRKPESK